MMDVAGPVSILLLLLASSSANPTFRLDGKEDFIDLVKRTVSNEEDLFPNDHMDEQGQDGDMKFTPEQQQYLDEHQSGGNDTDRVRRKASSVFDTWPNGVVPYTLYSDPQDEESLSSSAQELIRSVISYANDITCLNIRPAQQRDQNWIEFFKGDGCWSYVGKIGGKQRISIGNGCAHAGIIFHEICHALSFWHEQSRPDRDDHVTILWDNIPSDRRHNFNRYNSDAINTHGIPYDTRSVMHYSSLAFSHNRRDPTIITNDPLGLEMPYLGNRNGPTLADVKLLHLVYNCPSQIEDNCGPSPCINDGLLLSDCQCLCPPEYTGNACQLNNPDYVPPCLTRITPADGLTGTIISPNYPGNYDPSVICQWLITGPPGSTITLTFTDFYLQELLQSIGICYFDYVEVFSSDDLRQDGVRLCGSNYDLPLSMSTSTVPQLRLVFATSSTNHFRGFSANYVIDDPSAPPTTTTTTTQPPPTTTTTTQPPPTTTTTTQPPPTTTTEVLEGGCGGPFTDSIGRFTSPEYPDKYPNNKICTYEIILPEGQRVALTFEELELHCTDSIEIHLGDEAHRPMRTSCGKNPFPVDEIISVANRMTIVFTSDHQRTKTGFSASYRAVNLSPNINDPPVVVYPEGRKCKNTGQDEGYIQSKNYPNNYPKQSKCEFIITAPIGSHVELRVHDETVFDINCQAVGDTVSRDWLEIDFGDGEGDRLRLCGDEAPTGSYVSWGNEMIVTFRTRKDTDSRSGFRASYQTVTFLEAQSTVNESPEWGEDSESGGE